MVVSRNNPLLAYRPDIDRNADDGMVCRDIAAVYDP